MIITKIVGGLGNQLFQYAAGKRLASIHNVDLKLDLSSFEEYTLHEYKLGNFEIHAQECTYNEIKTLKGEEKTKIEKKILSIFKRQDMHLKESSYIKEKSYKFDPSILDLPDNIYLEGYWQSERYFKDEERLIRKEYKLNQSMSQETKRVSQDVLASNSISVHVRRADYLKNPQNQQIYEELGPNYYKRALAEISRQINGTVHLFVFSDDIPWVRENLDFEFSTTYMDFNGPNKNYEDLYLMSLCKHHVIANSSFSWWGAWLGQNPNKLVLAPKRWYKRDELNTKDRYPDNWIRI